MTFAVVMTDSATRDLQDIHEYVAEHDAPGKADHVLAQIEKAVDSLYKSPERGPYPKELLAIGVHEYREVFFKPYRIIYRVAGKTVYILLIADGRPEMLTLLQRRLLDA